jgi:transcriptional regulator with XRE-family HTH domain
VLSEVASGPESSPAPRVSQSELSSRLGRSASAVSQAFSGARPPREDALPDWAAALDVDVDALAETYHVLQGMVARDGVRRWYADLGPDPTDPPEAGLVLGNALIGPLAKLLLPHRPTLTIPSAPELEVPGEDENFEPYYVVTFAELMPGLEYTAYGDCAVIPVPVPLAPPARRRAAPARRSPATRVAAVLDELTAKERDLALAYMQGLLDARNSAT